MNIIQSAELIRENQIRAVKIGQWRVRPEDVEDFIRARTNKEKVI